VTVVITTKDNCVRCTVGNWTDCSTICDGKMRSRVVTCGQTVTTEYASCDYACSARPVSVPSFYLPILFDSFSPNDIFPELTFLPRRLKLSIFSPACTVSLWSDWSNCSTACGDGSRFRTKQLFLGAGTSNPPPGSCDIYEDQSCKLTDCDAVISKRDLSAQSCTAEPWSEWSSCTAACTNTPGASIGTQYRFRHIIDQVRGILYRESPDLLLGLYCS